MSPSRPIRSVPARALVKTVSVVFVSDAQQKAATDQRLTEDSVRAAIEGELHSRKLLSDTGDVGTSRTIEISVDGFSTRKLSNAVVFGQILSSGTLTGQVEVRDAGGAELQSFRIKAGSRLTKSATSDEPGSLSPLYRKFADLTVDNLAGAPPKPADLSNKDDIPR